MTYQVRNIIVGAAALYVSATDSTSPGYGTGPALPAAPVASGTSSFATALEASAAFRHAGFTSSGLELSYNPSYGDIVVDQLLDSARLFKQSLQVMIKTSLTEASLENLVVAWALQDGVLDSTTTSGVSTMGIAAGALGDDPVERTLVAVGPGPKSDTGAKRERIYHARRVLSVTTSAFAIRRTEATVFPVEFRLLPDPNPANAGAEYGIIRDRVV